MGTAVDGRRCADFAQLGFGGQNSRHRDRAFSPLFAPSVLALIFAPLFCDFVQNNPRACSEVEAFDHAEHRDGDAHLASFDGQVADSYSFATKPDCKFGVGGVVAS